MATLQQTLLDAVIRKMPAGVIVAEAPSGKLIAINDGVEKLFRHPPLYSTHIDEYAAWKGFHPDGRPYEPHEWPLARAIERGETVEREDIRILRGDGTYGMVRLSAAPVHDASGTVTAAVVTLTDITDQWREQDSLKLFSAASAILGQSLDSGETVSRLARLAVPGFADLSLVYLLDGEELRRHEAAAADAKLQEGLLAIWKRFPPSTAVLAPIVASGTARFHATIGEGDWDAIPDPEHRRMLRELGFRSVIHVPLRAVGVYGVMSFIRVHAVYDETDVVVAEELGRRAAAAVEKSLLFEAERGHRLRAERSEQRIADLQLLTAALATAMSVDDVATEVTKVLERVVNAHGIVLTLRGEDDELHVIRAVGFAEEAVQRFRVMALDLPLPLPTAVRTRQAVWKRNRNDLIMEAPLLESVPIGGRAWAALPMELHGRAIGAIGFSFSSEQAFEEEEQKFLLSIAAQCAIAIERARLFDSERRAREEAERASRAKDEFLAVLSHELRTPMTTVIGWADFLQMTHGHDVELAKAIEALRNSAKLQAKLVDDLLDVSRIVSGKLRIRMVDTELTPIVANAIGDVRISAREKGIGIDEQLSRQPLPIRGDPDRLRQIVTNLLVNAIKFTPYGGKVTVEARNARDAAEVVVSDTGEGISADFLPHVFDRFRQASVGDSRRHSGLGLGLSIVQHLVERHGGTVHAESDGLGKGARFTVRLPKRD